MSQKQKSILSFLKQATPLTIGGDGGAKSPTKKKEPKECENPKSPDIKSADNEVKKEALLDSKNNVLKDGKKETPKKKLEHSKTECLVDDSPIKQTKKRKRAAILESDEESQSSDELPNKKSDSSTDLSKKMNGFKFHKKDNDKELTEVSEIDFNEVKIKNWSTSNITDSSAKQNEPMDVEENKNEPDNQLNGADLGDASQSSSGSSFAELLPKRKTARKQVKSKLLEEKMPTNKPKEDQQQKNKKYPKKSIEKQSKESDSESKEEVSLKNSNDSSNSSSTKAEETGSPEHSEVKNPPESESESKETEIKKEQKLTATSKKTNKNVKKPKAKTEKKKSSPKNKKEASSKKEGSSSEDESESTSSKAEDKDSKKKIHPFFGKGSSEETSPKEESADKKSTKASPPSGYNPSKNHYHPIDDASWKHGEKVPYLAFAKTLDLIENTSGRLKMIEILSNYFRSVIVLTPEDLLQSVYLCLNRLAPEHEGIELGIGELLLMKALAQATGRTTEKIKAEVALKGDLGLVAENSRGNQRLMFAPPKLTVRAVFSKFKEIAMMTGNSSMAKKVDKIQALFVACRECEAKYIIRSLSGKLRIGLAEQSVLAALSRAAVMTPPNQSYPPELFDKSSKMGADAFKEHLNAQSLILKTTYCECPNYDLVIPVLLKEGIAGLPEHCQLTAGFPLKPMLAHPTNGVDEVLNRFDKNEFTCEFKYDGERAQIHRTDSGEIKIYSRNQEENTSKYPDIISRLPKALKKTTKSFILDTEAVAWDCETKQILPFQVLSTRKKKDAVESDIVVQVCVMAFDLIYLNGESLVKKPLKERREKLHSSFVEVKDEFQFVTFRDGNSAETMQEFLDESIKGNCEGLMVKALAVDASYEIAKRSHNWLKLKKDYLSGVGDTIDLFVIGGYHGKGKRAGFYGGFLLACYDDDNEEFQTICKLGTGFSDTDLENHTKFFKEHVLKEPRSYYRYDSSLEPDVWFDAVQIWEIKCADLSISPIHKAAMGIVDPEKGISLRFPRFLRIREDKTKPEDATNSSQIAEMYQKQDQIQNAKKVAKNEEDYY